MTIAMPIFPFSQKVPVMVLDYVVMDTPPTEQTVFGMSMEMDTVRGKREVASCAHWYLIK